MKQNRYLLLFLLVFILISCGTPDKDSGAIVFSQESAKRELSAIDICHLSENRALLGGNLYDIAFLSDTSFVLANDKQVIIYNTNGEQLKVVGSNGRGPGEYVSASNLFVSDKYIYVWCSMSSKLLAYDKAGKYMASYSGFKAAVKKFVVLNDEVVYFYTVNRVGKSLVKVYDLKSSRFIDGLGVVSLADVVLSLRPSIGGICVDNGKVLFVPAGELSVSVIGGGECSNLFTIDDSKFSVEVSVTAAEIYDMSPQQRYEFIASNSMVLDVSSYEGRVLVLAETGEVLLGGSAPDLSGRNLVLYEVDSSNNPVNKVSYVYPERAMLYELHDDKLYYISYDSAASSYLLRGVVSE